MSSATRPVDLGTGAADRRGGGRLPSLTALRFFAAALVVVVHLQTVWPGALILQRGDVGVSFFYLLSGFILTWAYSTEDSPGRFYRRRVARIVPLHLATWAIALGVYALITGGFGSVLGDALSLVLLQAWDPTTSIAFAANGVAWSLSVEVLFYACFPFLLPALGRLPCRALWVSAAAMVLVMVLDVLLVPSLEVLYLFPLVRLPEFVIGVVLALLVRSGWRPPIGLAPAAVLAALAVAVDFLPVIPDRWTFAVVTVVPFGLLIAAASRNDLLGSSRMAGRWWVRLGEWSFALFMTHQIVLRAFAALVPDHRLQVVLVAPVLLLCVGVAGLTFRFLERPLERRLRGRAGAAPAESAMHDARASTRIS